MEERENREMGRFDGKGEKDVWKERKRKKGKEIVR